MFKIICLFIFSVICMNETFGQRTNTTDRKAAKYFQEAKELFREGKSDEALELLEKAKETDASFALLHLLQADIFNKQGKKLEEVEAIEKAVGLDSLKTTPYYYYVLADYYFNEADYATAQKYYALYLKKDIRRRAADKAMKQLKNCAFALDALEKQERRKTEIFYESEHDVYWPSLDITGNTLLFTEQEGAEEALWMLKDGNRYPVDFNATGNIGTPSLTADGQMMYFSMTGRHSGFDIYVAYRLSDTTWSEPVNLGEPINTDGWETQPAISADGTKLYFASNREGGRGGSDIWFSRLQKRETNGRQIWSQPRCLYFNTPGDEMAPYLYFDNTTLFFSSDNYPGMGAKDIYKVNIEEVSEPVNIGITVNTQKDELGFVVDAGGKWGYFSSDVNGKKRIYRYLLDDSIALAPAIYMRIFVENESGQRISPEKLIISKVKTVDTLAYYDRITANDNMLVCVPAEDLLLISAQKQGYLYHSDTLMIEKKEYTEPLDLIIRLKKIASGQNLVLKGVFFDVDDYQLRPESSNELQQVLEFLRRNPDVKIEISGHTDNTGNDEHNYRLSENRAFEVYKYFFMHRIKKERMSYKGYGKDKPLAPNTTEEGRAKNRRTEITIE